MEWKRVSAPRRKADYLGRTLILNEDIPAQWWLDEQPMPSFRPKKGAVVSITRRINALETASSGSGVSMWGSIRVLKVNYKCGHCHSIHSYFIPESWIVDGRVEFVEMAE